MPCSLACIPYCTLTPEAIWAVWVARGDPVVVPPVYHWTVFAAVPLTSDVAVSNGGPLTTSGPGVAFTLEPKPSAANAAGFELVTVRLALLPPNSVTAPPLTVEGVAVPVIESIFDNNV